jgi:hypothetical protein
VRLFELKPKAEEIPADLTIAVGDVLRFAASGGRVLDGGAVEALGAFVRGTLGTDGRAMSPAGTPNAVLFRAVAPGRATIDIVYGDPFGSYNSIKIVVTVEE